MSGAASRIHEQNNTAQLAAQFNEFYLQITLPAVSQIGNYKIVEEIGEGAFGKVYLAQHVLLDAQVVLKCGLVDDPNIVREIYYHRQLKHKNIVKLYEIIRTETHLWIALEYCEGNELFYYIYEKRRLDPEVCRNLFYQIVDGIKYVHLLNLSHRDLKLENILLADKRKTAIKLTDFGFVREFNPHKRQFLHTVCGTTAYMAPELLRNEKYSGFAIDIWSLGVVLYAMLYGELPFDEDDDLKTKFKILHEEPTYRDTISPDTMLLLRKMLSKDPASRPSLTEIFNLPFLVDITNKCIPRNSLGNDTESIISINQHYRMHSVPFQTRIERHLLKRMAKLNIDTDSLQSSMYAGQCTALTALYELALAREFKKKKYRHMKKKRYYEAKRQIKRSKKKVRSVLSLTDLMLTSTQPLEHILLHMSLGSVRENSKTNPSGTAPDDLRKPYSARSSFIKRNDLTASFLVLYDRAVSFLPDDRRSNVSFQISEASKKKKLLERLQFWKRSRKQDVDLDDDVLEINVIHKSPSPAKKEGLVEAKHEPLTLNNGIIGNGHNGIEAIESLHALNGILPNDDELERDQDLRNKVLSTLAILENHLEPGHRRTSTLSSIEIPHMQASISQDSYYRRPRPESVVSQYSQLSHMYAMSESELDMDGTDMDELFDDDSSVNTTQHDLRQSSRKARPGAYRAASETLIISIGTGQIRKKYLLSQVSSNSSDESSVRSRLIDGSYDGPPPPTRLMSPRIRSNHPKLRGSRPTTSPKTLSNSVHNPSPINPMAVVNGIGRSHSPPISKKFNKLSINGNAKSGKTVDKKDFKYNFDTAQVDSRWNGNGTATPMLFEGINEEEEEED